MVGLGPRSSGQTDCRRSLGAFGGCRLMCPGDYAFRRLVRAHGCTLCYTEMLMASRFAESEDWIAWGGELTTSFLRAA